MRRYFIFLRVRGNGHSHNKYLPIFFEICNNYKLIFPSNYWKDGKVEKEKRTLKKSETETRKARNLLTIN